MGQLRQEVSKWVANPGTRFWYVLVVYWFMLWKKCGIYFGHVLGQTIGLELPWRPFDEDHQRAANYL